MAEEVVEKKEQAQSSSLAPRERGAVRQEAAAEKVVLPGPARVMQYPRDYSLCAGCSTCEIVCALTHDGVVGPRNNRIWLHKNPREMMHTILSCQHCEDHPCFDACPRAGEAMQIDERGIVWIDEENCIGCGLCARACKYTPARINVVRRGEQGRRVARKCDLCRTRPEGPACIEWCPARCIGLSTELDLEPLEQPYELA